MGGKRTDRFTWERAVLDSKIGMPRELLCLALVLATYSTGKTGGDIEVSAGALCEVLGYDHARSIRRLLAELRDRYGVIERVKYGSHYRPPVYALVLPGDLAGRAEAAREAREARLSKDARGPSSKDPPGPSSKDPPGPRDIQTPLEGPPGSTYQDQELLRAPSVRAPTAQTILAEFIDWDRRNDGQLTKRTTGQLARHISDLLAEGIEDKHIRRGLAAWRARGQHPSTLHSFVDESMQGQSQKSRYQTETEARHQRWLERARAADAAEAAARGESR